MMEGSVWSRETLRPRRYAGAVKRDISMREWLLLALPVIIPIRQKHLDEAAAVEGFHRTGVLRTLQELAEQGLAERVDKGIWRRVPR